MKNRQLTTIGTITKTQGFEGAVTVKISNGSVREPKINEPVFIIIDGIPVPFFVRDVYYPGGDTMNLSFDDYTTASSVLMFKGCELKYEASAYGEQSPDVMTGYTIFDVHTSLTVVITSIDEKPGQLLATVELNGKEIYIPLHPDLIINIDHRKKTIKMDLPEGLIDLNS
jgi:16S rRNA processing protein RimM